MQLVDDLMSPHGAIRDTAQRLLVERQNTAAVEPLRALTASALPWINDRRQGVGSHARLHAAWTLRGLNALKDVDVMGLLHDPDPRVQQHGIILFEEVRSSECLQQISTRLAEGSPRLRWQWAFTLGQLPARQAIPGLKELAPAAAVDPDLRTAWLSSVHPHMGSLSIELLAGNTEPIQPLLVELARLIGASPKSTDTVKLVAALASKDVADVTRSQMLTAIGEGVRRRGTSIARLLSDANAVEVDEGLKKLFVKASVTARDSSETDAARLAAVALLALADAMLVEEILPGLLTPQTSPALQQAAVKSLIASGAPRSVELILAPWKTLGPGTRREIVDQLVSSASSATALVKSVESGAIKPGEIERDKRQLLSNHPTAAVRAAAIKALSETPSNRKQVVADYQPALELDGVVERGQMLYSKNCLQCHRVGTNGHQVGPDLASVQNKSPADLLIAILDPNREAQPSFQTYTAVTKQGKIHTGIISAETTASLTLKRAEAKEDVVLRETLDELISTGQSLMPEGLEKDIDQQALADLIVFIKAQAAARK